MLGGHPCSEPRCLTGFPASSGLIIDFANSVTLCDALRSGWGLCDLAHPQIPDTLRSDQEHGKTKLASEAH